MKYVCIFLLISLCALSVCFSQNNDKYAGADLWYRCEDLKNGTNIWTDSSGKGVNAFSTSNYVVSEKTLNFHNSVSFDGEENSFKVLYNNLKRGRLTVMTVFHAPDTNIENGLWKVHSKGKQIAGFSDCRLYREKTAFDYPVLQRGIPSVNTSKQSFSNKRQLSDSADFYLGLSRFSDTIEHYFSGNLAECLVWSSILNKTQTLQAESYLALKYGITLIKSDYLSSTERKVWNYEMNSTFSNDIAGLARDDFWGLYQKQSGSTGGNDSLIIFLGDSLYQYNTENQQLLYDGSFLIWGHNNGTLTADTTCGNTYSLFERKWLLQATNSDSNYLATVQFPKGALSEEEALGLYLFIDRSGTDDFSQSEIISPTQVDSYYVYYQNVVWDIDNSGYDMFTFGYGLRAVSDAIPSCPNDSTGGINLQACGGIAPYVYTIIDSCGRQWTHSTNEDGNFENLFSGTYTIHIQDNVGSLWKKEILVSSYPHIVANEFPNEIKVGEIINMIEIFPDAQLFYWYKSDTLYSENSILTPIDTGIYKLTVKNIYNCTIAFELLVNSSEGSEQNSILNSNDNKTEASQYNVYPNPARGFFTIEAKLIQNMPLKIEIYTINGQFVRQLECKGNNHYIMEEYLNVSGEYIIRFISKEGIEEKKIAIKQ